MAASSQPPTPTSDPEAFFAEHGWLVVRGAIGQARVAAARAAFHEALRPYTGGDPDRLRGGELAQLPSAARMHPALLWHLLEPESGLAALVARLLGARGVKLLQDNIIIKPAQSRGGIDWHTDATYTGFLEPAVSLSVRLSLSESTVEGGCMWVVDGSHRWPERDQLRALSDERVTNALERLPAEVAARVDQHRRPLPLAPGDVSIHHGRTLHASFDNRTDAPRMTVVAHVVDGDAVLVPERLPDPDAARWFPTEPDGRLSREAFPALGLSARR